MVEQVDSAALRPTVMVAEDCRDARRMLKVMLEVEGYRVVEAPHGGEAVRIAARLRPDLIVMDMDLPVLDGCAATRLIHARRELRQIPIVAVSAHAERRWREEALAAGCAAFLAKPLDLRQFGALIGQLVR